MNFYGRPKQRLQFCSETQNLISAFNIKWRIRTSLGTLPTMACLTVSKCRDQCDLFIWNGTVATRSYKTPKKSRLDTALTTFRYISDGKRRCHLIQTISRDPWVHSQTTPFHIDCFHLNILVYLVCHYDTSWEPALYPQPTHDQVMCPPAHYRYIFI